MQSTVAAINYQHQGTLIHQVPEQIQVVSSRRHRNDMPLPMAILVISGNYIIQTTMANETQPTTHNSRLAVTTAVSRLVFEPITIYVFLSSVL